MRDRHDDIRIDSGLGLPLSGSKIQASFHRKVDRKPRSAQVIRPRSPRPLTRFNSCKVPDQFTMISSKQNSKFCFAGLHRGKRKSTEELERFPDIRVRGFAAIFRDTRRKTERCRRCQRSKLPFRVVSAGGHVIIDLVLHWRARTDAL